MINKKRRIERAKTATHHKSTLEERKSFGEEAKQTLRNMSLINNMDHAQESNHEWTKQQDNLSAKSFAFKEQPRINTAKPRLNQKMYRQCTRNSAPQLPYNLKVQYKKNKACKTQLVPYSVDLNNFFVKQKMYVSQKQSYLNHQLRLFNSIIFRKTTAIINKSFKSLTNRIASCSSEPNRHPSYFNLDIKDHCKQIVPLKINFSKGLDNGEDRHNKILHSLADERLKQNKGNIVRKLLKDQRNYNLNETLMANGSLKPQF